MKECKLTLTTKEGCGRLLAIFIAVILVSGLCAQFVQTDGGRIKVEPIMLDARGAELSGELYYPAGTTGNDKMPAVIVNHGGGCVYGTMKNMAQELARRGFVVFNVSAYGSGLSAQPDYDDAGQGINGFYQSLSVVEGQQSFLPTATPMGLHDAVDFVRSLAMVDSERIGMVGHSMGAYRVSAATTLDCGYYTFNDIMLNVLHDQFGQNFTESELAMDADTLAAARLNADQLAHYDTIRKAQREWYDTRVRSEIILGVGYKATTAFPQTVQVAGHDVLRNVQSNICWMSGDFDAGYEFGGLEDAKAAFYAGEDLVMGDWYLIDDNAAASTTAGSIFGPSVTGNAALGEGIAGRTSRIYIQTGPETHSKEFFSSKTNSAIVKYFEQTLEYNNGPLGSGNELDAANNTWGWRVLFNSIALFSMIGMVVALGGLLVKTAPFRPAVPEAGAGDQPVFGKKELAIFSGITVVLSFLSIYYANAQGLFIFDPSRFWPLGRSSSLAMVFVICLAIAAAITLLINVFVYKKSSGKTALGVLNLGIGVKNILRHIALAIILVIAAYISLAVSQYFFGQEYRIWMTAFSEMKADYWYMAFRYVILLFPLYLVIAAALNYTARADIPQWKDDVLTVVINSAGIWLCCLVNILIALSRPYEGLFFSSFICSYHMVTVVPVTAYLNRKMYRLTNSIWTGAALCSILVAWSMVCTLGINDVFYGQTWLGNFLFH